jgi:hypothetical protein
MKGVMNLLHTHVLQTAVYDVNIHHAEELNLWNRQITVYDIASDNNISDKSIWNNYPWELIIQESVCLVGPRDIDILPDDTACCCVCWNTFQEWIMSYDEMWVNNFTPEPKSSNMRWRQNGPLPHKNSIHNSQLTRSWKVFWDSCWSSSTWWNNQCSVFQWLASQ